MSERHSIRGKFYEFFAGGGMARAGLGPAWTCLFANDVEVKKAGSYAKNWGEKELETTDVAKLSTVDLPGRADLAWASFPCQDLSLAGMGAGLKGARSGTFWSFWKLIKGLAREGRQPDLVVAENVVGTLSSRGGHDFSALSAALASGRYRFGALVIDAVHFVPQSRPRLFIIGVRERKSIPKRLLRDAPLKEWSPNALLVAHGRLSEQLKASWIWWNLPEPPQRITCLEDLIEDVPRGVRWHTQGETKRLRDLMSPLHQKKVEEARRSGRRTVGAIYKRTRAHGAGHRVQRAEIRFDGIAGCLRTPLGGSSRQFVMFVEGRHVRSRLISPREAARLMGLPESYQLPDNYNEAYHLAGDGVVVPVVRYLAKNILEPVVSAFRPERRQLAAAR